MTPPAAPASRPGWRATLAEGMTVAASSSKLLRSASIYVGLLMLALTGPAAVTGLALIGQALIEVDGTIPDAAANAVGAAGILIVAAFVGAVVVSIEGGAIGVTLLTGQVVGRPVRLRDALERSRAVFWRLARAGLLVGLAQAAASHLWQVGIGVAGFGEFETLVVEPVPSAVVALPFLYSTVAIVLADEGTRSSLRLSARIARRVPRVTIALALFGTLSGAIQAFALGSGVDLIARLVEAVDLDVTSGLASFGLAAVLALAAVTATGSLLFTVAAVVSAPQVVTWTRLGLPLAGMPEPDGSAASPPAEAAAPVVAQAAAPAVTPPPAEADTGAETPPPAEADTGAETQPPAEAMPPPDAEAPVATAPPVSAWAAAAAVEPPISAWAAAAAATPRFRWVSLPMRLAIVSMWLIATAALVSSPPG